MENNNVIKTTEEMVNEYLETRKVNLKPYSYSIVKNILYKHFISYFKDLDLNKLSPSDINNYYLSIAKLKLKNKTKNNIISSVMVLIEWLDLMEYISVSISRKFKQIIKMFPMTERPKSDYLTIEEIKKLIDSIEITDLESAREKLMIEVLSFSGLRKSELRALTFNDVDMKHCTININKQIQTITNNGVTEDILVKYTKTNSNRIVNLPKWLIKDIKEYHSYYSKYVKQVKEEYNDIIFPYKVVRINRILNRHLKNANLKHIKVHDLRHSYCTMLYENGADSKFVQKQLGHSSDRTSRDIYEHLTNKMELKGIRIVNKLI